MNEAKYWPRKIWYKMPGVILIGKKKINFCCVIHLLFTSDAIKRKPTIKPTLAVILKEVDITVSVFRCLLIQTVEMQHSEIPDQLKFFM